ncbi:unnamed protein product [Paramecium pentaurelia]|uniref:Uncharacterized protein n=1 Tax=Paramecium pentaurelia TaxID=43138 RepID=A0A8S1SR06_9CILI|nr:unnamed protein product [Paramecium pentaurelia]CAD8140938.1 unnamed protein product [Paramecium pentaurelia]CAD8140946.1 unnamed protein product [Paramecium pentaurelia]CAD8140950.1 unnamed protein product [Paramecium pentaurelia]
MNQQLNQIIWRKFFEDIKLDQAEQKYLVSLLPINSKGITIDLYVYSNVSRKMYYIHLFETKQDVLKYLLKLFLIFKEEINESLQLKGQLCRYDEKYQNNIALFRTKGLKLKSMRKIIERFVNNKPICTGIFDTKQYILRNNITCTFNINLHWEPEAYRPILIDDRLVFLKEEEKTIQQKDEVQKLSWLSYKQHQIEMKKNKIIILEDKEQKIEFIKID